MFRLRLNMTNCNVIARRAVKPDVAIRTDVVTLVGYNSLVSFVVTLRLVAYLDCHGICDASQ